MKAPATFSRRRSIVILIIAVAGVAGGILLLTRVTTNSPAYHEARMMEAYEAYWDLSLSEQEIGEYYEAFVRHRDALVRLGYYDRVLIETRPYGKESEEQAEIAQIIKELAGDRPLVHFAWQPDNERIRGVMVYDRPDNLDRWRNALAPWSVAP